MPRTGKGGSRQGQRGGQYSNRTDLQAPKVPTAVAPSAQYGSAVAQQRALQAMPIAPTPGPPPPAAPAMPAAPVPITPLDAPTDRPDEHVMTGAPVGPGAGTEALGPFGAAPPSPLVRGVGLLSSLGDDVPDQIKQIRSALIAANGNNAAP